MSADERNPTPDELLDTDETEAAESAKPERSARRFRVDTASGGPGKVVLDVNMPEKNGIEVLTELRKDEGFAAVPVLMLTVHSDRATFRDAMAGGAVDYVLKPVNQADLTERLRKYL